jgi:hypothetical protein
MALPNSWKEWSPAPASWLLIQSAARWPLKCAGWWAIPAYLGTSLLTG